MGYSVVVEMLLLPIWIWALGWLAAWPRKIVIPFSSFFPCGKSKAFIQKTLELKEYIDGRCCSGC